MTLRLGLWIVFGGLAGLGCRQDKSESTPTPGAAASSATGELVRVASCDRVSSMSLCSESFGLNQNALSALGLSCTKLGGTLANAECPNSSVLGNCAMQTGERRKFYAGGGVPYDAARAARECRETYRGTWSPLGYR